MQLACIRHCLFITQPSNTSQRLFIVQPSIIPLLLRLALWVRFHFSTIVCKVEFSESGHRDVDRHRARGHGGFARRLHQKHGGPSTCPRALLHRSTTHNTDALILLFFPTICSFHQFFFYRNISSDILQLIVNLSLFIKQHNSYRYFIFTSCMTDRD